jgi:hypothetical protein
MKNWFCLLLLTSCTASPSIITTEILGQGEIKQAESILQKTVDAVMQKNLDLILPFISEEKGLWIDLKSHKEKKELPSLFHEKNGYFENFYFHTESLRKHTEDPTQISIHDLLKTSGELQVQWFVESETEMEARITLKNTPEESYRLNHPVFIKVKDQWYLWRIF